MSNGINLSLCMIVKDNELTIRPCLESIKPWVDEMIVVDTGSTDRTPEIVESYGARLFHRPWDDDFSAARNHSIDQAAGEWIFWMDSDDTIPTDCGTKLKKLARSDQPDHVIGFVMKVHCPSDNGSGIEEYTVVDHVKMFRNRPEIRFEGRIHEQVLMPIRRAKGEIRWTDIYVVHSGSDPTPEAQSQKIERDLRILRIDLAERPDHPFVLFNFAMTYAESGQFKESLSWVKRCLAVSKPHESHVRKAYAYLTSCFYQLERPREALDACKRGREYYPDDPELLFREAMTHHVLGSLEESISCYLQILKLDPGKFFQSSDPGISSFKCRFNLAVVLKFAGRLDECEIQLRKVLREKPNYRPANRALFDVLYDTRRFATAQIEVDRLFSRAETQCLALWMDAQGCERRGNVEAAGERYIRLLNCNNVDEEILGNCCRFFQVNGDLIHSVEALQKIIAINPKNESAINELNATEHQMAIARV